MQRLRTLLAVWAINVREWQLTQGTVWRVHVAVTWKRESLLQQNAPASFLLIAENWPWLPILRSLYLSCVPLTSHFCLQEEFPSWAFLFLFSWFPASLLENVADLRCYQIAQPSAVSYTHLPVRLCSSDAPNALQLGMSINGFLLPPPPKMGVILRAPTAHPESVPPSSSALHSSNGFHPDCYFCLPLPFTFHGCQNRKRKWPMWPYHLMAPFHRTWTYTPRRPAPSSPSYLFPPPF